MVNKPRIYQLLRQAGVIYTRADAMNLLKQNHVQVDGKIVRNPEYQVNPKKEQITVNGKPLLIQIPKKYYMLNKPVGFITSKEEEAGKRHILELIHEDQRIKNTLFPIGRLDCNTSGIIIITNDGEFANKLLQPESNIEKEYLVQIKGMLKDEQIRQIESGIIILVDKQPYKTLPSKVRLIRQSSQSSEFSIIITEGKKRQIRLMLEAIGHKVQSLKRIRIGTLAIEGKEGEYKEIKQEKIKELKSLS